MNTQRLRIYRSGAGSGKTFKLGIIYLNLVLQQPTSFRQILGITFTNKAAAELKNRILLYLATLAADQDSSLKSVLIENLGKEGLVLSPEVMALRAREALGLILHNYGEFAVSTIDSFMHRVVSTFAFDLHIASDFEVILDTAPLAEEVTDRIISKVGRDENITLLLEITLENQIDDEKGWNLRSLLTRTTESLFREDTRHHLPDLLHMNASDLLQLGNEMRKMIAQKYQQIKLKAGECMDLINKKGLQIDDFYQKGRGPIGWIDKIMNTQSSYDLPAPNSYINEALNDDKWFSGKKPSQENAFKEIKSIIKKNLEDILRIRSLLYSLHRISDALPSLALTGTLAQEFEALKEEENFLHISDFNELIRNVIIDEPVPYIYYRLGHRFRHYLLDEFQDTSVSQWHNLVPLLANSLAESHPSLAGVIVGDGKQSIYRFRNGELQIFEELPQIYLKPAKQSFHDAEKLFSRHAFSEPLSVNRRSEKHIVEFNNAFFKHLVANLPSEYQLIKKVYNDLKQTTYKTEDRGYVEWNFVNNDRDAENNLAPQAQQVVEKILDLREKGYAWKDMAVLVRRGLEGQAITTLLGINDIPVLSSDSLLLNTSPQVLKVIAWLYFLQNPGNDYYRAQVLSFYNKPDRDLHQLMQQYRTVQALSKEFLQIDSDQLSQKDIYSLCEYLLLEGQNSRPINAHAQTLLEYVQRLISQKKTSIADLLSAWEDSGDKWSVNLSGDIDAVQVMTIHKAKGLEFRVVLLPYLFNKITDWEKSWLHVPEAINRELFGNVKLPPVILAPVKNDVGDEFFGQELSEINEKRLLDRLNVLYVAFTRAKERLYIFSEPFPKSTIDELRKAAREALIRVMKRVDDVEVLRYPLNALDLIGMPPKTEETSEDLPSMTSFTVLSKPWEQRFKIRRQAPEDWLPDQVIEARRQGISLHQHLSRVIERKDLQWVTKLNKKGSPVETAYSKILSKLQKHPLYNEIFLSDAEYLSEREIVIPGEGVIRPDLIIIHESGIIIVDYKTGAFDTKHERQIQQYCHALQNAGYKNIKGYLVYLNEEVEVRLAVDC